MDNSLLLWGLVAFAAYDLIYLRPKGQSMIMGAFGRGEYDGESWEADGWVLNRGNFQAHYGRVEPGNKVGDSLETYVHEDGGGCTKILLSDLECLNPECLTGNGAQFRLRKPAEEVENLRVENRNLKYQIETLQEEIKDIIGVHNQKTEQIAESMGKVKKKLGPTIVVGKKGDGKASYSDEIDGGLENG